MKASRIISVSIQRPYAEVYDFLADQANFARWAINPDSIMEPLGGNEWLVDIPRGRSIIRFTARNPHGVLDYSVRLQNEAGAYTTPVRLVPNEEGADLVLVWFRAQGIDDARFDSEVEWIASDLQRLKSLIEAGA